MAEVGILNLQIKDNSQQAIDSLGALAGALSAVKTACQGFTMNNVAKQIEKITEAANKHLNEETIARIDRFATAISKLNGLGDININLKGADRITKTLDSIEEGRKRMGQISESGSQMGNIIESSMLNIGDATNKANEEFSAFQNSVNRTEKTGYRFNRFDPKDLPFDKLGNALSDSSREWSQYGDMVKDSFETIRNAGMLDSVRGIQDIGKSVNAIIPYNENLERTWDGIARKIDEAREAARRLDQFNQEMTERSIQMGQEAATKYYGTPETFEEILFGSRTAGRGQRDLMSQWLQGKGTQHEQNYAFTYMAREFGMSVDEVKQKVSELLEMAAKAAEAFDTMNNSMGQSTDIIAQMSFAWNGAREFFQMFQLWNDARMGASLEGQAPLGLPPGYIQGEGTVSAFQEVKESIDENGKAAESATEKFKNLDKELRQKKTDAHGVAAAFNNLKKGITTLFKPITRLISQFARIVRYRIIRSIIRSITQGFREGTEHVYEYSKAIGSTFHESMDAAASSLATMKNALGASIAPLLQMLIPYLQQVVNWFINLLNYANQFFALLNGQATWTRALPATATAFDKQKKAAKGAAAAVKDLLADWDELNIIQSETSGAGSGAGTSAAEDYLHMFEEVGEFDNKIKEVVNFLKDNFDQILSIAELIGATMLAWRISNAFAGLLPILSNIMGAAAVLGTVTITLALTDMFGREFANKGGEGWFIADALTGAIGSSLAWGLANRIAGGSVANIAAGFTLTLAGAVNIKNALGAAMQKEYARWGMLTVLGSVEAGIGAALIGRGIGLTSAFSFGLGALAAVGAVAISVGALIQLSKDNIDWGEVTLTDEDVTNFVEQKMFTGLKVKATIDLIKATVEKVSASKTEIEEQVAKMLGPINAVRLGVDKKASYEELKKQIFGDENTGVEGLISKIQTYATNNVQELKTTFALIPILDQSGTDVSDQFLEAGITGWQEVNTYVNGLGKKLGEELSKGFTEDGLANFDEEAVRAITEKMVRISQIITGSQIESAAQADLSIGLADLAIGDLDKNSVEKVVSLFSQYKDQLEGEYTRIYKDAANQYLILSRYYAEIGDSAMADFYQTQYDELIDKMPKSVSDSVKRAAGPGLEMVYGFLKEKFGDVFDRLGLNLEEGHSGMFELFMQSNFQPNKEDIDRSAKDFNSMLAQWLGGENIFLQSLINKMPGLNVWDMLDENMRDGLHMALRNVYGDEYADKLVQKLMSESIEETKVQPKLDIEPIVNENEIAKDIKDSVEDATKDGLKVKEKVDIGMTATQFGTNAANAANSVLGLIRMLFDNMAKVQEEYAGREIEKPTVTFASATPYAGEEVNVANTASTPIFVTPESNQTEVDNTAAGVQRGTTDLVAAINNLITIAQAINRKDFVVNVSPSSTWGAHTARSGAALGKVTGDMTALIK